MPHYKDGTPARVGDRVRGRGYNIKGEIEGYVLRVTLGDSCNLVIGTTQYKPDQNCATCRRPLEAPGEWQDYTTTEYGETAAFKRID